MNASRTLTTLALWLTLGIGFAQSFPMTVEHKYGLTTLKARPERVVTLGYNDQDAVYAVGDIPVAVRHWFGEYANDIFPWAEAAATGARPTVLNMTELDLEAVLSVDPDLIIAAYSGITGAEYAQLSQIAPTLAQSGDYQDYGTPWQEMTESIGQALGQGTDASAAVEEVEQAFSDVAAAHPEFAGKSIAVALFNDATTYYVYQSQENRSRFFTNLGFEVPATFDALAGDSFYFTLSEERFDLLNQDVLVTISIEDTPESLRQKVEGNPLLGQLDVVKKGHTVYVTGTDAQALGFSTVLSLPYALENILPDLTDVAATLE